MKFNDLTLGILVLVAGIAIFVSALGFNAIPGQTYGAGTMPRAIAICAIGLGIAMLVMSLIKRSREPLVQISAWARSPAAFSTFALTLGLIVFYILAAPAIGFVPTALVVMCVLMLALRTAPITAIAVSILACVVIQQAFGRLLLVPLPRSELLGFLW